MTRFARAKGSKASNERMPNDATPWHIMKQQLEDNNSSKSNPPEPKAKTAKQLLNDKDDLFYYDNTGNVNNDWAEFDRPKNPIKSNETTISKNTKKEKILTNGNAENTSRDAEKTPKIKSRKIKDTSDTQVAEISKKIKADCEGTPKKSTKRKSNALTTESTVEVLEIKSISTPGSKNDKKKTKAIDFETISNISHNLDDNVATTTKIKAKKRKSDILQLEIPEVIDITDIQSQITPKKTSKKRKSDAIAVESVVEHSEKVENAEGDSEPKKKKKRKRKDKKVDSSEAKIAGESENKNVIERSTEGFVKISKRHKRNQKRKNKTVSDEAASQEASSAQKPISGEFDTAGNEWSSTVNFGKQKFENKLNGLSNVDQGDKDFKKPLNRPNEQMNGGAKRKAPKIRDDKEHKRRKPQVASIKCTINGTDVEIVQYDGFPVTKEDAERLKELRKQLILKGIPKSEINAAMKLERRKAEKSLSRMRKHVCFHCRKAGHNLSDCPELGEGESATGICFKCGSTEHTHFECKVQKKQEYGFASCFICREQGHIAKQCPDNPKGLYPQGGSCKICGDVTHLRKDCPELTKEKEESSMTLGTIAESTLESLDENETKKVIIDDGKKAKIVKF